MSDTGIVDNDDWSGVTTYEPQESTPHVQELVRNLRAFLQRPLTESLTLGQVNHAVYAFFDIDKEPLYVGQTKENLGTRLGRHLTGQRSDPVAKRILDPMEVVYLKVWPLPQYQVDASRGPKHLDALEYIAWREVLLESTFASVFNEKQLKKPDRDYPIPAWIGERLLSDAVAKQVLHPDLRILRRAQTLAALAQVISQRQVDPDIRQVLLLQAERLTHLIKVRAAKAAV